MSQPRSWLHPESFGALLQRERRRARLTQEQLAERAGYSPSYIGMLERGERLPPPATARHRRAAGRPRPRRALTGPASVGKTRMAVAGAAELSGDFSGVWFAPLARLEGPGLVVPTVARVPASCTFLDNTI